MTIVVNVITANPLYKAHNTGILHDNINYTLLFVGTGGREGMIPFDICCLHL